MEKMKTIKTVRGESTNLMYYLYSLAQEKRELFEYLAKNVRIRNENELHRLFIAYRTVLNIQGNLKQKWDDDYISGLTLYWFFKGKGKTVGIEIMNKILNHRDKRYSPDYKSLKQNGFVDERMDNIISNYKKEEKRKIGIVLKANETAQKKLLEYMSKHLNEEELRVFMEYAPTIKKIQPELFETINKLISEGNINPKDALRLFEWIHLNAGKNIVYIKNTVSSINLIINQFIEYNKLFDEDEFKLFVDGLFSLETANIIGMRPPDIKPLYTVCSDVVDKKNIFSYLYVFTTHGPSGIDYLKENYNIISIGRYGPMVLNSLFTEPKTEKNNMIIIFTRGDTTTATYDEGTLLFMESIVPLFNVIAYEIDDRKNFTSLLKQLGKQYPGYKASFMVIFGHGEKNQNGEIELVIQDPREIPEVLEIDFRTGRILNLEDIPKKYVINQKSKSVFKSINAITTKDATILLYSCRTGIAFGSVFAKETGRRVYAQKEPIKQIEASIRVDDRGEVIIEKLKGYGGIKEIDKEVELLEFEP